MHAELAWVKFTYMHFYLLTYDDGKPCSWTRLKIYSNSDPVANDVAKNGYIHFGFSRSSNLQDLTVGRVYGIHGIHGTMSALATFWTYLALIPHVPRHVKCQILWALFTFWVICRY